jgi:hypothetical protein
MTGARAMLREVIANPETKPRWRAETELTLALMEHLGIDDPRDVILFLIGTVTVLQERIDQL